MKKIKYYFKNIDLNRYNPLNIDINGKKHSLIPKLFNSELKPLYHFFHVHDIKTTGWLELDTKKCRKITNEYKNTKTDEIYFVEDFKKCVKVLDDNLFSNLKICSFDIECTSENGSFPLPENEKDYIIQIGMAIQVYNNQKMNKNYIITLDTCDKFDDNTIIEECETEEELLEQWMIYMEKIDPDIIIGYNINGFDFRYIIERCEKYGIDNKLYEKLSRLKENPNFLKCSKFVKEAISAGMGENKFITMNIPGRCIFDINSYMRTFHHEKFDSYKLDYISNKLLGQKKDDVSPKEIFKFQKENSYKRSIIAKYCVQDCNLVNLLTNKLCVIENLFGMASTCYVNPNSLLISGQNNKGFSLLSKKCMDYNYIIPYYKINRKSSESYSGAFVLTAVSGCHYFPVSCLDFSSLYPSCMISHNLCISSFLDEEKRDIISNEDQVIVNANIGFTDKDEKLHHFYKPKKIENLGVIPKILMDLLNKRKECKKLMKNEKDKFKKNVLDGLQLAYKVTANSIYGLLGDRYSQFYKPQVAESVTATGRNMLITAQDKAKEHFPGSRIIYGDTDSIFVSFKIKDHNKECIFNKCNDEKRKELYHNKKIKLMKKYDNDEDIVDLKMMLYDNHKYKQCECEEMKDLLSKEALQYSIDISLKAEKLITRKYLQSPHGLIHPHTLEYEKTYSPYILLTKKRYIGYKYEFDNQNYKLDYKGLALKRRNYSNWVKIIYKEIVEKLLHNEKTENLFIYLKEQLLKTLNDEYDVLDFQITKAIKSITSYKNITTEYKNEYGQNVKVKTYDELLDEDKRIIQSKSHIMLNEIIRKRDPGEAYNVNERIPYCFVIPKENVSKGDLQYKFINTPKYIKLDDYKINYEMYFEKQLEKPLSDLFNLRGLKNEFINYIKVFKQIANLKNNGYNSIINLYE
jgi:DNA polymerase delta subunit 1